MQLSQLLGNDLQHHASLAKYTAARLGGNAEMLYVAKENTERLAEVVQTAWADGIPVRVIGSGANVLIADSGIRGLVIVNRITEVHFGEWHDGRTVSASAGMSLTGLSQQAARRGYSGFEWAVSVPGTLGGAVVNNAGAHGGDMSHSVCDVVLLDAERGAQMLFTSDLAYDYRTSSLKQRADKRFLVLWVNLALPLGDPVSIRARMEDYQAHRKRTQPAGASLGSIFKNPLGDYAGRLIEACNLKGYRIGNVTVSEKHANFFISEAGATATDYRALVEYVQQAVLERTGTQLETEIELLGWEG
ncbi:MAG: UDP-N-acetylmuramate dehydrogenase [Phototrophicaceae bacterium]